MRAVSRRDDESGMALVTVFMVLMLASALMVGFFATIAADQRANGIDRDQTQAYAAAHAGLEKLTSGMATLFVTDYSPSKAQIDAIVARPPVIPGFTYTAPGGAVGSGYAVTYNASTVPGPNFGNPIPDTATGTAITAGPYAGFKGIITKYPITITARSTGGAEVRLRRELQTVAVPVFQFGVFSETDLTFYAGDNFDFGGRVQTNGSLFLSELAGFTLSLSDRVTAFREVVRANLSNGRAVAGVTFTGTVRVLNTTTGIGYRNLGLTEGSVTGMPTSTNPPFTQTPTTGPPSWTTISTSNLYYKSLLRTGLTGAKYLSLPLVSQGAVPIDLIRRPAPPVFPATAKEDVANPLVFGQRYFHIGYPDSGPSLRILLSDTALEIMDLPTIVQTTQPVPLDGTALAATQYGAPIVTPNHRSPFATSPGRMTDATHWMATAAGITATTVPIAGAAGSIPAHFKIPATIAVGANPAVVCTGRTATQFTGCSNFVVATVPSAAGTVVSGFVASGALTVPVSTSTTAAQVAIPLGTTGTLTVASTAAFAPTAFWLTSNAGRDGGSFTCTGYTQTPTLTGCAGLPAILPPNGTRIHTGSLEVAGTALNRGFIKIEMRNNATPSAWEDVTKEILELGISGPANAVPAGCDPTPNAVLRLQHVRDNPGGVCIANGNSSVNSNDYWPNVLYDAREGTFRDDAASTTDFTLRLGGIMNYVALDVGNLTRWLAGTTGLLVNGPRAMSQNGFIVYFSDRRGNKCLNNPSCPTALVAPGVETGEYGFEDNVNPLRADGLPVALPRVLDVGEDVNAFVPVAGAPAYVPVQDVYGMLTQNAIENVDVLGQELNAVKNPSIATANQWTGLVNRPVFFRRALKLINGGKPAAGTNNLPTPGLTIASENPVYVQGNYNATVGTAAGVTAAETHMAAAILADSITLLSSNWNDNVSFQFPNNAPSRVAATTGYRFAAVSGKGLSFPWPAAGAPQFLFGTDGGVGNFLRLLEDWAPGTTMIRYRGSIVSLFISRQAVGTYKFTTAVYNFGLRNFIFDNDFLLPALLPPGTPMFRDVNTLTFRQLLRPNQ